MLSKYNFLKLCLRIAKKEKIDFDTIELENAYCAFSKNDSISDYFLLSIQENKYIPFYKKTLIEWHHLENIHNIKTDFLLNAIYALSDKDRLYNLNEYF